MGPVMTMKGRIKMYLVGILALCFIVLSTPLLVSAEPATDFKDITADIGRGFGTMTEWDNRLIMGSASDIFLPDPFPHHMNWTF